MGTVMYQACSQALSMASATSALEERSVRGFRRDAAGPHVADAVIAAVSHSDLPECIRWRAFCVLIHMGRQQDAERGAVVPVRRSMVAWSCAGSALLSVLTRAWQSPRSTSGSRD